MARMLFVLAALLFCSLSAQAQARRQFIRAVGEATVSVPPDQVKIDIGVTTQASGAQEASTQNANQVSVVLAQLRQLLGTNADIKTINYSVTPNYRYPQGGGNPTLVGYIATNTVEATLGDVSLAGKVIDTAAQAGATTVSGLRFGLKDEQPARAQALRLAAVQARAHADAIASGLGVRTGAVVSAEEGAVLNVQPRTGVAASVPTPIEPGTLDVHATVTLEMEIAQ